MNFKGFGTPAATSAAPSTGFSFGATPAAKTTTASTGLSFGGGGGLFGGGAAITAKTTTASTGLSFGTGGGLFGATSTAAKTTAATTGLSLGGGLFGGASTAATTTSSTGLSLGGGGLFGGAAKTTASTGSSLFSTSATSTATSQPTLSLGGTTTTTATAANKENKLSTVANVKDETVPEIICKDVESFKAFTKKQLEDSNEVAKFSVQSLNKITDEANSLSSALAAVSSALQNNKGSVLKLREEFATELENAGMVRRMMLSMQHDDMAPMKYFFDLVCSFESNMQLYQKQIDELEKHLHSITNPSAFTCQDISTTLCKMQETYVGLASNLHSIHEKVKTAKEQFLTYRRVVHGDNNNPFAPTKKPNALVMKSRAVPNNPGSMSNVATLAMANVMQQQLQMPNVQQTKTTGFGTLGSTLGGTTGSLFGNTGTAAAPTTNLFGSSSTGTGSSLFGSSSLTATTSASTTGFSFGNSTALKPTLSAGFKSTSSGNFFGSSGASSFNSSAGVTFGGSALKSSLDLKLPNNTSNKRNKK